MVSLSNHGACLHRRLRYTGLSSLIAAPGPVPGVSRQPSHAKSLA